MNPYREQKGDDERMKRLRVALLARKDLMIATRRGILDHVQTHDGLAFVFMIVAIGIVATPLAIVLIWAWRHL